MDMRMEKKVGAYAVEIGHCAKRIGNPLEVFQVCGYYLENKPGVRGKNDCKDDTFWLLLTIINKVMTMEMQMGDGSNKYFIS